MLIIINIILNFIFQKYIFLLLVTIILFYLNKKLFIPLLFIFSALLPQHSYINTKGTIIYNHNILLLKTAETYYKIYTKQNFNIGTHLYIFGRLKNNTIYQPNIFVSTVNFNIKHNYIDNIRIYLHNIFKQYTRYGNLIDSIILGINLTDYKIKNLFIHTGIYHLFSISGLHITLFTTIIYYIIKKILSLNIWFNNRFNTILVSELITIYILILYLKLIIWPVSAIRAVIMYINYKIFNLDFFSSVSIASILILTYNPKLLFDWGFLLSFTSTLLLHYNMYLIPIAGLITNIFCVFSLLYNSIIIYVFRFILYLLLIQIILYTLFKISFLFFLINILFDIILFILNKVSFFPVYYFPSFIKLLFIVAFIFLLFFNDFINIWILYIIISIISCT